MNKTLVAYFSCTGETKLVAEKINNIVQGTLYEIIPEVPYTKEDLDWTNKNSRTSIEMSDNYSRPAIKNTLKNMDEYNTIYLGFPIWWYIAPKIINTFLESYNLKNKKLVIFCTSGSSAITNAYDKLKEQYPYNFILWNKLLTSITDDEIKDCIKNFKN